MVSNEEIKRKLEAKKKSGVVNGSDITCPHCGVQNPANSKFCQSCGKNLLNTDYAGEKAVQYSDEKILGYVTTNDFNRLINVPVLGMKHDYLTLFFTTHRLVIIETIQFAGSDRLIGSFGIMGAIPAMKRGKQALEIADKLSVMTPDEIFSSNLPYMSIPYSLIKEIKIKKTSRIGPFLVSGGKIDIFTDEETIKYPLNSIQKGVGVWNLVHPDLGFLESVKPILKDKLFIR